jgi:hypothetical protein
MPLYVFVALPIMALSALKFGEAAMDIIKSLPPLVVSLIPGNEKQLENLRKRRAYLAEELNGVIGKFKSLATPPYLASLALDSLGLGLYRHVWTGGVQGLQ